MVKLLNKTIILATAIIATTAMAQEDITVKNNSTNIVVLNNIFDTAQLENLQASELSNQEMKDTQGDWVNFAVGGAIGFGTYAATNYYLNKPITWQGSLYSVGTGALTGGIGSSLGRAAGGGLGNVIWKTNGAVLNTGLGTYRNYRGW